MGMDIFWNNPLEGWEIVGLYCISKRGHNSVVVISGMANGEFETLRDGKMMMAYSE